MRVLTLYPLSACEISGGNGAFLSRILNNELSHATVKRSIPLVHMMRRATFPEITDQDDAIRRQWFESYITTILQRVVRQIADIALSIGQNAVTGKNYRILLQMVLLTFDVKPWFRNIGKRLVKSGKGYITDTSLLCYLRQTDLESVAINQPDVFGQILENLIASELMKQLAIDSDLAELYRFRTSDGKEVDFLLEKPDGAVIGIEVNARDSVKDTDFYGLRELR